MPGLIAACAVAPLLTVEVRALIVTDSHLLRTVANVAALTIKVKFLLPTAA
jgi:hypothetical protein